MKKLLTVSAISMGAMLAVSLLISNASSADSKGEKPRDALNEPIQKFAFPSGPDTAAAADTPKLPTPIQSRETPKAYSAPPLPPSLSPPSKVAADAELGGLVAGPPVSLIPALAEQYKKAIADAVAAGELKSEQAEELSREYEALIAIRKARLEVMRAIHILEGIQNTDTKQGQEAKRLRDALQSALQVEQTPVRSTVASDSSVPCGSPRIAPVR